VASGFGEAYGAGGKQLGVDVTRKVYIRALAVAAALAALVVLSCGEPLGATGFAWVKKADAPFAWYLHAVGPKGVYGIYNDDNENVGRLFVFNGSQFLVDYEVAGEMRDVGFAGDAGFLSYTLNPHTEQEEAVLTQLKGGTWTEVLRAPAYEAFWTVSPINANACWLAGTKQNGASHLLRYEGGHLVDYGDGMSPDPELVAYSPGNNTFYAITPINESTAEVVVWATSDDGSSWRRETWTVPGGYEINNITDVTTSPEALYITCRLTAGDWEYYAVVKRSGPAGDGEYEFVFITWTSPETFALDEAAFRDDGHGVAVGLGGSVYYDAPEWRREATIPYLHLYHPVADPGGGFWCTSSIYGGSLLWHP
jgi:hypothetical protein